MTDAPEVPRPTKPPHAWAEPFFTFGVTGTNGKTSTSSLIASVLRAAGKRVLLETTLGYRLDDETLDVPRTLGGYVQAFEKAAQAGSKDAVVEVTSQALANGYARKWRFDLGVFTNLSRDHLDAHGSFEHYLASKAQLFVHLGPGRTAVLNAADETSLLLDRVTPPDVLRLWYAAPNRGPALHAVDLSAASIELSAAGTRARLEPSELAEALGGELEVPLVGHVFAENALGAACAALRYGIDGHTVRRGLASCPQVPGRFEIIAREPIVAVDFAHTPDALARMCDSARALAGDHRVIVVFGAGGGRDKEKRGPMGRAVGQRVDRAIVTNDNPRHEKPADIAKAVSGGCRKGGRAYVQVELDRRTAIRAALEAAKPGDVVVIAGKGHEPGQTIGNETLPFSDAETVRELLDS
ncbi:MAG: UDP-N-acetylmuramoyl-L-alanyl-D-glutamate--2,6-diaminopimelate ligase [Myxococcales bacterium]|nr:UDP-N-acetylmuramoyl-L-alanyl-D-glutamate--2,6-diaminopimelate ligase [Myxococcales bacterium]MCB9579808.1 UDP-N-acetylmuramoyl-L-alanyl-D-glutamate--2,6-diaminopimelate ligase [Polyangiaceae bacterium]